MDDLVNRVAAAAGLEPDVARRSVTTVLAFLQREGPPAEVGTLMGAIPGAHDAVAGVDSGGGPGGMAGLPGMGVMGLASELGDLGLSLDEMGALAREVFSASREAIGEDATGAIVGSIPGLGQYV